MTNLRITLEEIENQIQRNQFIIDILKGRVTVGSGVSKPPTSQSQQKPKLPEPWEPL